MRAFHKRSFIATVVGGLLSSLVGHPMVAWGASCSVQAAATTLGDDVWIHGVATCAGGVRGIRFFVGNEQVGETPGADGFATWHAAGAAGTYTIRVAASETSDSTWMPGNGTSTSGPSPLSSTTQSTPASDILTPSGRTSRPGTIAWFWRCRSATQTPPPARSVGHS